MSGSHGDDSFSFPPVKGRRVSRWGLAPLLFGSAATIVVLCGQGPMGAWLRGFLNAGSARARALHWGRMRRSDIASLRRRLLGRRKARVVAAVGRPQTVLYGHASSPIPARVPSRAFWRADTWYYRLGRAQRTALIVHFERDIAVQIDVVDATSEKQA